MIGAGARRRLTSRVSWRGGVGGTYTPYPSRFMWPWCAQGYLSLDGMSGQRCGYHPAPGLITHVFRIVSDQRDTGRPESSRIAKSAPSRIVSPGPGETNRDGAVIGGETIRNTRVRGLRDDSEHAGAGSARRFGTRGCGVCETIRNTRVRGLRDDSGRAGPGVPDRVTTDSARQPIQPIQLILTNQAGQVGSTSWPAKSTRPLASWRIR